ncbi:MAG: hypothetical protein IAI50_10080 [Candidatus Eremiobacteraeota bacterium]|nr:hypothetical protein [Candidatus Eremiobacteraeota bacterium]
MRAKGPSSLKETTVRRIRIAIALSLLVHFLIVFLFWRNRPLLDRRPRPEASPTETITIHDIPKKTIEKRIVVKPVAVLPRKLPPRPPSRSAAPAHHKPAPSALIARSRPVPHELAKVVPHATARPPKPRETGAPNTAGSTNARPQLSGARIAQMEEDLGKSIAHDREGIDPLHVPPGAPPQMKHYGTDYAAFTTGEREHHGLCDPIKDWTLDGYDYYYVACNVRFSDGSFERQDVPWPIRFDPHDDPFNGTSHGDEPLAMPLPGWHLPPGENVTVELREYAKSHGVDI